jgi:hypothetical protein
MLILAIERRSSGHAYAGMVSVTWRGEAYTLMLQRHPTSRTPWQASLHQTPARITAESFTNPLWRSRCLEAATLAIDALLEHVAPLGLPDDLYPLVLALLPEAPIGQPVYSPSL